MDDYLLPSPHSISISLPNVSVPCTEQEEVKLVTASRAGDQDAFAQLVLLHQRRVFNLVYRMLQNYEETNEVTQDTFLAAWQGLPKKNAILMTKRHTTGLTFPTANPPGRSIDWMESYLRKAGKSNARKNLSRQSRNVASLAK